MKRSIRIALVLALTIVMSLMLSVVSFADDPATLAVGTAQVTAAAVNVRTGPGTNYPAAGKMTQGTLVPVLDFNPAGGFIKVSFEGAVRYVAQSGLNTVPTQPIQVTPAPAPVAVTVAAPAANADPTAVIDRVTITANVLNVRTGPSKNYPVAGKVTAGTVVPVLNYNAGNGYAQISYEGAVRYAYVSGYSTRVVATVTSAPAAVSGVSQVTAYLLNVRTGPGTGYNAIGTLSQNEAVTVLNYNAGNGFAQISYQGQVCYASLSYLTH